MSVKVRVWVTYLMTLCQCLLNAERMIYASLTPSKVICHIEVWNPELCPYTLLDNQANYSMPS